jgi:hypothetical protein
MRPLLLSGSVYVLPTKNYSNIYSHIHYTGGETSDGDDIVCSICFGNSYSTTVLYKIEMNSPFIVLK